MPVWTTKRISFKGSQQTGVKRPVWFWLCFVFFFELFQNSSLFFPCQYYYVLLSMEIREKLPFCFVL